MRIGSNFVSKIRKEIGAMFLLQMKPLFIFYHQEKIDELHQMIYMRGQNKVLPKIHVWGAFRSKSIIKL